MQLQGECNHITGARAIQTSSGYRRLQIKFDVARLYVNPERQSPQVRVVGPWLLA